LREFDDNRRISITEETLHCEEPDSNPEPDDFQLGLLIDCRW
jgi:hypothetical protein